MLILGWTSLRTNISLTKTPLGNYHKGLLSVIPNKSATYMQRLDLEFPKSPSAHLHKHAQEVHIA
jgi:hypothetical protein